ncbi:hypothetical protein JYP52_02440 [Nitratireductor aquibiodomus]|uniref:hypothetical protein n=1 Tax=Nitratireductor aquibiodomus TaxID=204799 RepID=UPI0019D388C3|nr:hypothetical protein [Nitratireductor aquibiodomus]MBN7759980.1 hypothetical protein [Nitratireductor aquibiodomus]
MKITFLSEDHPDGLEVDWPEVPRIGDNVSFRHQGGTNTLRVFGVTWHADGAGEFESADVHLTY